MNPPDPNSGPVEAGDAAAGAPAAHARSRPSGPDAAAPLDSSVPVVSCAEAHELEQGLFQGDPTREWTAMQAAGRAVATAVVADFLEIGGFPPEGRVLVLAGKGHNGGDALLAASFLLEGFPHATVDVVFVYGSRTLRPLAARAWQALADGPHRARCRVIDRGGLVETYDLCLDGIFGFSFRPPVEPAVADLIAAINARPARLRASVDLPSAGLVRADFTYGTGSVKDSVLVGEAAGRVRYLDLGFFGSPSARRMGTGSRVLTRAVLRPLAGLRRPATDKRSYGHVFVVGGSRSYPGAVLMATLSALRSGAGLVTAFVPETLVAAYAARAPEAMWVGWPETPNGGLALEGLHLFRERAERASALLIGPGLTREPETLALAGELAALSPVPLVLDADALQPEILARGHGRGIVTPHAGEFARIAGGRDAPSLARETGWTVVLKGPITRIASGAAVYHSLAGGPVLARGGSGDLLAGLVAGLLAQRPADPLLAAARGVIWHGEAADLLARARGQVAVNTTEVLDYLAPALRSVAAEEARAGDSFS